MGEGFEALGAVLWTALSNCQAENDVHNASVIMMLSQVRYRGPDSGRRIHSKVLYHCVFMCCLPDRLCANDHCVSQTFTSLQSYIVSPLVNYLISPLCTCFVASQTFYRRINRTPSDSSPTRTSRASTDPAAPAHKGSNLQAGTGDSLTKPGGNESQQPQPDSEGAHREQDHDSDEDDGGARGAENRQYIKDLLTAHPIWRDGNYWEQTLWQCAIEQVRYNQMACFLFARSRRRACAWFTHTVRGL